MQVRSVRTDAEGRFLLSGLTPGTYTVTETGVPTGYLPPDVDSQQAVVPQNGSDTVTFVNDRAFEPVPKLSRATRTPTRRKARTERTTSARIARNPDWLSGTCCPVQWLTAAADMPFVRRLPSGMRPPTFQLP